MTTLREPSQKRAPRVRRWPDHLLTVAAVLGGLSMVIAVLAAVLGYSLIVVRTGSMEPALPIGSVAVVESVEASEIRVGDILAVDRGDDRPPITHRVTSTEPSESSEDHRLIRMKGDANDTEDLDPYDIQSAKRVLVHVAGASAVTDVLFDRWVMLATVPIVAGIVYWAFSSTPSEPTRTSRR